MSPLYALQIQRAETLHQLSIASSSVVRDALQAHLQRLTLQENALRVRVSLSRDRILTSSTAPVRCALRFDTSPHILPASHWSFDETADKENRERNRILTRLHKLFGAAPERAVIISIHRLGGIKKAFETFNLDVFLSLPEDIRLSRGAFIIQAITNTICQKHSPISSPA